MSKNKPTGSIVWTDLTVEDAAPLREFYTAVAGWKAEPVSMGKYDDYNMTIPESGETVAGICHAKGPNIGLPAQWLMYVTVDNLDASIDACREKGGRVVLGPKEMGPGSRYAVIQDPAGAVVALYEEKSG